MCLALIDAGIPMNALVASVTCGLLKDGTIVLDPDEKEEQVCTERRGLSSTTISENRICY